MERAPSADVTGKELQVMTGCVATPTTTPLLTEKIDQPNITNLRNTICREKLRSEFRNYLKSMYTLGTESRAVCNQLVSYFDSLVSIKDFISLPASTTPAARRRKALAILCDTTIFPTTVTVGLPTLDMHLSSLRLDIIPTPDEKLILDVYNELEKVINPKHEEFKHYVMLLCNYLKRLS